MWENTITKEIFLKQTGLQETLEIWKIVKNDVDEIILLTEQNCDDPLWRRLMVRTVFSGIEVLVNRLKLFIIESYKLKGQKLSAINKEFLYERKVDDEGILLKNKKRVGAGENVKQTFKILSEMFISDAPDFGGKEWGIFICALKTRDRLTHPKCLEDLSISAAQYYDVASSFTWFEVEFKKIINTSKLRKKVQ